MEEREAVNGGARGAASASSFLVIDDEEVIHVSLRRMLGRKGHQVDCVLTAAEGLEKMRQEQYDMVITDLMMPEIDGLELLERMNESGIKIPVLMITGYPTIKTALQSLRMGAVDYLAKPFTRRELFGPINRALRQGSGAPEMRAVSGGEDESADGITAPERDLMPGDRFYLRRHSWAVFQQDGTMLVGIHQSFLNNVGRIASIVLPDEADLVEQGFTGFRLKTDTNEDHNVFIPLSGQVVAVNSAAAADPDSIDAETWLVRILPDRLESELELLIKG